MKRVSAADVKRALKTKASKARARVVAGYFKTGPGEYGEGDIFIGVTMPDVRRVARRFRDLPGSEVSKLLRSPIHEERQTALIILVDKFSKGTGEERRAVYDLYVANLRRVNNWDLVDISAPNIVGAYLFKRSRRPLYSFVRSKILWERRVAILATFYFIKKGECEETLGVAEKLLDDEEDLIHKAVGWMLREVGKRDLKGEEVFLKRHYKQMPRTMLRYAIERFPNGKRQKYLKGKM